jgi:hypothetical protein
MLHDTFDSKEFKAMFALRDLRREARDFVLKQQQENPGRYANAAEVEKHIRLLEPSGEMVTSPYHMAVIEQLRRESAAELKGIERVPTDVFVFARGEPKDRRVTKVGGLPYWPGNHPWPMADNGEPMRFVAQFCFIDSRSMFKDLPGELLLIFCSSPEYSADDLACYWINADHARLVTPRQVPESNDLLPVYGVRRRTHDFARVPESMGRYHRSYLLGRIQGTKIGGLPNWIQGEEKLPGRFLCALGSISPTWRQPFRYVNTPGRRRSTSPSGLRELQWGDVGSVYFFIDNKGEVRWTEQCY